jgi:hypothetical protein
MTHTLLFVISVAATGLGLFGSWAAFRRRGAASGLRGTAWSLLPIAAYLTGLTTFLADLVFSPVKWLGVALFGLGALLYVTSGVMLRRKAGGERATERLGTPAGRAPAGAVEDRPVTLDSDLSDIEQILKKRGIS